MNLTFLAFKPGIVVEIPVRAINEEFSSDIRRGSFFYVNKKYLKVKALTADIPEYIDVDMTDARSKQVFRIDKAIIPSSVQLLPTDPNLSLGTVMGKAA